MKDINQLRAITAILTIIFCVFFEYLKPAFKNTYKDRLRFNGVFYIVNIIAMKIAFPTGIYLLATSTDSQYQGILSMQQLPIWLQTILGLLIFDLLIYWQHRFFHMEKFLWKFHITHHCDTSMDFTNAFRFHPGEIIISGFYKSLFVFLLTPRIEIFIAYEMILHSMAVFNHSNIKIPNKLDKILRLIIVTPAMHWPHHSPNKRYTNSNFGNFLSIWDRLFKTYTNYSNDTFGLDTLNKSESHSFKKLLLLPFKN